MNSDKRKRLDIENVAGGVQEASKTFANMGVSEGTVRIRIYTAQRKASVLPSLTSSDLEPRCRRMEFPVEILASVFSNAEPKELAAAARVCKEWSTLALDILWRDLESLVPLVELVVPIVPVGRDGDEWSARIKIEPTGFQWQRYDSYAGRVRTIAFLDSSSKMGGRDMVITTRLITSLVRLHPRGAICPPRLRKMTWSSVDLRSILALVPFLCDTLQDLTVAIYSGVEDLKRFIEQAIGQTTPHLKSLSLERSVAVDKSLFLGFPVALESSLLRWLSKLPLLESVSLPQDYQTTAIVDALGDLVYLTRLKLHYATWNSTEETTNQCFSFNSPSGFHRLETLEIEAPINRLVQLFQTSERFAQVKQITLSPNNRSPETLFNLTAAVAQRCPGITAITLQLRKSMRGESLSFQETRPLLACHSLVVFKIDTNKPFSINEQDLRDMALAWPGIQELSLSASHLSRPMYPGGFPLRLLPIAAGLFPTLRILRIYLDPEGDAPEFDHNTLPSSQFQSLRVLDVGASSVSVDPFVDLGLMIGSLCKLEVRVVGEFEFEWSDTHKEVTLWNNIQEVVTMLVKSKRPMP